MTTTSKETLQTVSPPTDGDVSDTKNTPQVAGSEFGLRPRKKGVFYLTSYPQEPLGRRLLTDGILCRGIDVIDGTRYLRFEQCLIKKKDK